MNIDLKKENKFTRIVPWVAFVLIGGLCYYLGFLNGVYGTLLNIYELRDAGNGNFEIVDYSDSEPISRASEQEAEMQKSIEDIVEEYELVLIDEEEYMSGFAEFHQNYNSEAEVFGFADDCEEKYSLYPRNRTLEYLEAVDQCVLEEEAAVIQNLSGDGQVVSREELLLKIGRDDDPLQLKYKNTNGDGFHSDPYDGARYVFLGEIEDLGLYAVKYITLLDSAFQGITLIDSKSLEVVGDIPAFFNQEDNAWTVAFHPDQKELAVISMRYLDSRRIDFYEKDEAWSTNSYVLGEGLYRNIFVTSLYWYEGKLRFQAIRDSKTFSFEQQ